MAWFKRFSLHLAAATGALGIFVGAAAVGAHQYRAAPTAGPTVVSGERTPAPRPTPVPATQRERSLAGVVESVSADELVLTSPAGRVWHVRAAPGGLLRLNGRPTSLGDFATGDRVVVIGVAQSRDTFVAHAITGRRQAS